METWLYSEIGSFANIIKLRSHHIGRYSCHKGGVEEQRSHGTKNRGRDWIYTSLVIECHILLTTTQEQEKDRPFPRASEEAQSHQHLDCRVSSLQN